MTHRHNMSDQGIPARAGDGARMPPEAGGFEWWYFDFPVGDRGWAALEWHAPLFTVRDDDCMLLLRWRGLEPGARRDDPPLVLGYHHRRSTVEMGPDRCRIVFPGGRLVEKNGNYLIDVDEASLGLKLTMDRQLPPVDPTGDLIFRTADGRQSFFWSVPLPRARVSGRLTLGGKEYPVDGLGYHDHNWGNLQFGRHLRGWIWLRVMFSEFTLIFAEVQPRGTGAPLRRFHLLDGQGRPLDDSGFEVRYDGGEAGRPWSGVPHTVVITGGASPRSYRIEMAVRQGSAAQEAPLGSFSSQRLNTLLAKAYYLFGLHRLPAGIKRWAGRMLYQQTEIEATLLVDGGEAEKRKGVLEVLTCDR